MLQEKIFERFKRKTSAKTIRRILTEELDLTWKKIKNQKPYVNSAKNVSLRKVFAEKFIEILQQGKIIVNFDETVIQ